LEDFFTFKEDLVASQRKFEKKVAKDFKEVRTNNEATDRKLHYFRDDYFPKFMGTFKEEVVEEVTLMVNQTTAQVVTEQMLEEALVTERETRIQVNIDKMADALKELLNESQEMVTTRFTKATEEQTAHLQKATEYIHQVNEMVLQHEQNFKDEDKDPEDLSPAELEERGITVRYGVRFDRDGNMVKMTKKEI